MGFYSYLSAYPQMIASIQSGKLPAAAERELVSDFVANNSPFARHCLLQIAHQPLLSRRHLYRVRRSAAILSSAGAAASCTLILRPELVATSPALLTVRLLCAVKAVLLIGLTACLASSCRQLLVDVMHDLIKNRFRPIDRKQVAREMREAGLGKYRPHLEKTVYCEGWPERAVILHRDGGFRVVFEELAYTDGNEARYLEDGSLDFHWVEDESASADTDTLSQAEKLIAEDFSHGEDRDADIFSWLD